MRWILLILQCLALLRAATSGVQRAVDVLLPCVYVRLEDQEGGGGAGGLSFTRQEVTLVIRNLTVTGQEEELDPITSFQPPEDPKSTVYQITVGLGPLPFAERLLHADCEGEEVICEISSLSSSHVSAQMYMINIHLPDLSIGAMTQTVVSSEGTEEENEILQDSTIISLTVNLLVSSSPTSHSVPIAADVSLNCEVWGDQERAQVEWHLQKEGNGQWIVPEGATRITVGPGAMETRGDASLTVTRVQVRDEGTYICAVTSGQYKLQQILHLQVREPPEVTVFLSRSPNPTLTCRTDRYYPLDVEVTWQLGESPVTHAKTVTSSHRRNSDGTYNLSTTLSVSAPPAGAAPETYTCTVTHVSVSEPITVTASVPAAVQVNESSAPGIIFAFFIILIVVTLIGATWWRTQRREGKHIKQREHME